MISQVIIFIFTPREISKQRIVLLESPSSDKLQSRDWSQPINKQVHERNFRVERGQFITLITSMIFKRESK